LLKKTPGFIREIQNSSFSGSRDVDLCHSRAEDYGLNFAGDVVIRPDERFYGICGFIPGTTGFAF
jgi:hypothetical protein